MRQNGKLVKIEFGTNLITHATQEHSFYVTSIQANINIQKWSPKHATKSRIYLVREVEGRFCK
ncbi:hypothetical protein CDL15_Pgr019437 [Punica granatum]|uniref:Uncharacterized protein n=1 Tax=Punica granatum TaxID=22663 RepID=A0A218XSC8_PUNGR|nr:hypothetical protein CDL15_Pgr019437 [Punica granatum]